jgi:hypothetical protein
LNKTYFLGLVLERLWRQRALSLPVNYPIKKCSYDNLKELTIKVMLEGKVIKRRGIVFDYNRY